MKLPDVNVLLYALNFDDQRHEASSAWLGQALVGTETVGFAWTVLLGVLRLSSSPVVLARPLEPSAAEIVVETWLAGPAAIVVEPGGNHLSRVCGLLATTERAGPHATDAHLAALAIEHDAEIVSYDRCLDSYPGVRRIEP